MTHVHSLQGSAPSRKHKASRAQTNKSDLDTARRALHSQRQPAPELNGPRGAPSCDRVLESAGGNSLLATPALNPDSLSDRSFLPPSTVTATCRHACARTSRLEHLCRRLQRIDRIVPPPWSPSTLRSLRPWPAARAQHASKTFDIRHTFLPSGYSRPLTDKGTHTPQCISHLARRTSTETWSNEAASRARRIRLPRASDAHRPSVPSGAAGARIQGVSRARARSKGTSIQTGHPVQPSWQGCRVPRRLACLPRLGVSAQHPPCTGRTSWAIEC